MTTDDQFNLLDAYREALAERNCYRADVECACAEISRLQVDKAELLAALKKLTMDPCSFDDYEEAETILAKHKGKDADL